mmetsp:Transcript_32889/g.49547  ORF Transcript_32889/g.49547 Transcript_32889/m.49547 type:complete len:128 (+) Transcript_32889:693-1076(+)
MKFMSNQFPIFIYSVTKFKHVLLLLSFPLSSVINVPTVPPITCILCHHGTLDTTITTAGDLLSNTNMRRHIIETLQLHLNLMPLTHLSNVDLPFMEDALLMIMGGDGGSMRASSRSRKEGRFRIGDW